jgi:hypothetical protein
MGTNRRQVVGVLELLSKIVLTPYCFLIAFTHNIMILRRKKVLDRAGQDSFDRSCPFSSPLLGLPQFAVRCVVGVKLLLLLNKDFPPLVYPFVSP